MFTYLIIYLDFHFGGRIKESVENYKEFNEKIDVDGSLAVELSELNAFFNSYLDVNNKIFKDLKMGEIFGKGGSGTVSN